MLLAVNSNFLVFSVSSDDMMGQSFASLVPTVAAAESAIGLAIFVITFRVRGTIAVESINSIQVQALLCRNLNVKSATLPNATSSRRIRLQDDLVTAPTRTLLKTTKPSRMSSTIEAFNVDPGTNLSLTEK
ncbi:hypothetical protein L1987_88159 [Smallanthus sonchifolius]|nr:hypothetical protein L1987_88159 [Smallanthus sonchifolius]